MSVAAKTKMLSTSAQLTRRPRRARGRLPRRFRLSSAACLYICFAHLSLGCTYAQRPRTTGATRPEAATSAGTTGAESWEAAVGDLVRFPSAEVEFIIGPQLKSGSALNPVPWYDQNALSRGLELGEAFPANPPGSVLLPGTISVTQNSNQITGAGTHFVQDFATGPNAYFVIHDAGGAHPFIRGSVTDDTHMAVTAPWPGRSSAGLKYGGMSADELDSFTNLNYYDQGLVQYTNYYRTGDARFLSYARKINDSWWKSTYVSEGRTPIDNSFSPRTSSLAGLMLRALDGRPEMWPWITDYVRQQLHLWVSLRADYAGFYYGIRDGGYMLLHAANLARVHPDPAVRAEFRAKALDGAVRYYARLQGPDGGFYFDLDDIKGTTQPFQEGILAEGLIAVHRLTGDGRVRGSIVKLAEHLYQRAYNPTGWRGMYYDIGGAFTNGYSCAKGCGQAGTPFPPADISQIAEARQLNSTTIHTFGYAYLLTGDEKFRRWGDEVFDATYSGRDGRRGLANFRAKEYDEAYRSSGKYLAWRLSRGDMSGGRPSSSAPQPSPPQPRGGGGAASVATVTAIVAGTPQSLVAEAFTEAMKQSSGSTSESQLQALLSQIARARDAFAAAQGEFTSPEDALVELKAAYDNARNALLILKSSDASGEYAKERVGWAAARLKRAGERMKPLARK